MACFYRSLFWPFSEIGLVAALQRYTGPAATMVHKFCVFLRNIADSRINRTSSRHKTPKTTLLNGLLNQANFGQKSPDKETNWPILLLTVIRFVFAHRT